MRRQSVLHRGADERQLDLERAGGRGVQLHKRPPVDPLGRRAPVSDRVDAGAAPTYDYTAIDLCQAVRGVVGIAMYMYSLRQYKRGKVTEYGTRELRSGAASEPRA